MLDDVSARHGLIALPVQTRIHEELYVVTAERQFSQGGQITMDRLSGQIGRK